MLKAPLARSLTVHYAAIQSVYNMGYSGIMSFAAVFLLDRGFSNAEVGITLTIASALTLLVQPLVAAAADRHAELTLRRLVGGMLAAVALLAGMLWLTPALLLPTALLYIAIFCLQSLQYALLTSLAIEQINAGVPLNFSAARGFGSLAFAALSLILGFAVDARGAWIIMPIIMALSLSGIALVAAFPRPPYVNRADGIVASGLLAFCRGNARFMAVITSIALVFFSHVLINTYTVQIVDAAGGSRTDMGIATALAGLLEFPAMVLFPLLLARLGRASTILKLSGVAVALKTVLTLLATDMTGIYLAQSLQFFAFALFVPASVYYVNHVIADVDKVKGQALMTMAVGVSNMVGNYVGGMLLDLPGGGVSLMLGVGLAVSLVGLVALFVIDGLPVRRGTAHG
ncbi:MAG: MFS transporter [Chloroflexi bacterium]|nr:MFS transporter [Chloroflexota bacterium]